MTLRPLAAAIALSLLAAASLAQAPVTSPPVPVPAAPSPAARVVSSIRNKLSAADLPSAESILEVHRAQFGEDGTYLMGLGWLARGALLLGEPDRARAFNAELRQRCDARLAAGVKLAENDSLENALGASIEVAAQLLERDRGREPAAAYVRGELAKFPAPVAFRARLYKRLNLLTLTGAPAPEIALEDFVGARPAALAARRGMPVLVFVWARSCGDCKAQAASLTRVARRHSGEGLEVLPLTRYYEDDSVRVHEKAMIDSVWAAVYGGIGPASIAVSTVSMERYGGSSTPTFVFVDRKGVVRRYTPTRLTEAALEREVQAILN